MSKENLLTVLKILLAIQEIGAEDWVNSAVGISVVTSENLLFIQADRRWLGAVTGRPCV